METNLVVAISNALSSPSGTVSVPAMREKIMELEEKIKALPGALFAKDFETHHHFGPGVYMRELVIPADTILAGRIHKAAHLNVLSKGKITVWTEEGMKTLEAPVVIRSEAGMKRVGYAHTDSIWMTVHKNPNDERDIEKVEAALFTDTFDDLYLTSGRDISDVCTALGITAGEMRGVSENTADQVEHSIEPFGVSERKSPIHGVGIFADKAFKDGDVIGLARIGQLRNPIGRFCNHGASPNCEMRIGLGGHVFLYAIQDIAPNTEILVDYYLTHKNTRPIAARQMEAVCQQQQ